MENRARRSQGTTDGSRTPNQLDYKFEDSKEDKEPADRIQVMRTGDDIEIREGSTSSIDVI